MKNYRNLSGDYTTLYWKLMRANSLNMEGLGSYFY
jgi:hypothetical protein